MSTSNTSLQILQQQTQETSTSHRTASCRQHMRSSTVRGFRVPLRGPLRGFRVPLGGPLRGFRVPLRVRLGVAAGVAFWGSFEP